MVEKKRKPARKLKTGRKTKEAERRIKKQIAEGIESGKTREEVALEVDTSERYVKKVMEDFDANQEEITAFKSKADEIWADKERLILHHVTTDKLKKASAQQLITSAAICKDKRTKGSSGLPTDGLASLVVNVDKLFLTTGSKTVAPSPIPIDISPVHKGNQAAEPLPLTQGAEDPCASDPAQDERTEPPPPPGGGVPGTL
jgi:hypothetical protein